MMLLLMKNHFVTDCSIVKSSRKIELMKLATRKADYAGIMSVKKELINVTCTPRSNFNYIELVGCMLLPLTGRTMDLVAAPRSRNSSIADMKQSASLGTSLNAVPKRSKLSDQENS